MANPPPLHGGAAAPQMNTPHSIDVKVMRLLRPEVKVEDDIYLEDGDVCAGVFPPCADRVDAQLCLPSHPGMVYEGEMFRMLLSLHNTALVDCRDVTLDVEVHAPSTGGKQGHNSSVLADVDRSSLITPCFASKDHRDYVMHYVVSTMGTHQILCHVSYLEGEQQVRRSFKTTRKFEVHRTVALEELKTFPVGNKVMVQSTLQNATESDLLVDLNFCPARGYKLAPLPSVEEAVHMRAMRAKESRRHLFQLEPPDGGMPPTLGRMEITWCGRLGERGRLETTSIPLRDERKQDDARRGAGYVDVAGVSVPDRAKLDEPFTVTATLTNTHPQKLPLPIAVELHADRMHPLAFTGPNVVSLGTVPFAGSVPVELRLIPVAAGVLDFRGIEVVFGVPPQLGRLSDFLSAAHVHVTR
eukprot:TRINITY_DN10119_c0_g1_i1.p2 TRINITY_DN10119_c0_g1~~TRINITY_DN10119_c0_g1_i1.p2  ORF type:complete len:413 (+),score=149.28 TRINITY_DN10119_c0_g1_i1:37-1275(+)